MTFASPHTRNDPPKAADEIEIHPGGLATAPRRVRENEAVPALRTAEREQAEFDKRTREEAARLAEKRLAAIEIQEAHGKLKARRAALQRDIDVGNGMLTAFTARLRELEHYCSGSLTAPLQDHCLEATRCEFLAKRIPGWVAIWENNLKALDAEIAAFQLKHFGK